MTTPNEIQEWLNEGLKFKATHVLIVCDTYDYEMFNSPEWHIAIDQWLESK